MKLKHNIKTILRNLPILKLKKNDLKISNYVFIEHVKMSLPMAFQASIIAIGALVVQFALNNLGAVSAYMLKKLILLNDILLYYNGYLHSSKLWC